MPDGNVAERSPDSFCVMVVIVLYQMRPSESAAFTTLWASILSLQGGGNRIRVLLYDNTPGGCDPGPLPETVQYEAPAGNAGLAAAYNRALAIAETEEFPWLLTLDQDTRLPLDYLRRIGKLALALDSDKQVAAIVPRLTDEGRPVSPVTVRLFGEMHFPIGYTGFSRGETRAFNSASLLRVRALKQLGGFNPYFWLDYVDVNLFRQLYEHKMKVYVAGDIQVDHELSLFRRADIKTDRFRNILHAESAFCDLYGGHIRGLALTGRLFCRIMWQWKRGDNLAIRLLTWNALQRRIVQSRARRIQDWKSEMDHRMLSLSGFAKHEDISKKRPVVSVCMAAYNGEHYITALLLSILNQLAADDEVVVVDDASTDGTRERVRSLQDGRIRLIEQNRNLGILGTFEMAVRRATGHILFLADQDDIWVADKVETVLGAFHQHPEVDVVVSDAALMDEHGGHLGPSYYAKRGRFRSGVLTNIFRCSYLGCTMAFRSRICARILPFPTEAQVLHDLWIGTANSLAGGKTLYIDRPLVWYRRHEGNATGIRQLRTARRIRMRWDLCRSLAASWFNWYRLSKE